MKVALICRSDATGGAAVVSYRLMNALRSKGIDARLVVVEKLTDSPYVIKAASPRRALLPFLTERFRIFLNNGLERSTLFQIDNASDGLPIHKIPFVREADVICLNWVNQGMLSLKGVRKLAGLGKPLVWSMHDMWNMTGICHHAGDCHHFLSPSECGNCPLLRSKGSPNDLSHRTFLRKRELYSHAHISFVAVSNWLAKTARSSTLMHSTDISVIPNAFPQEYLLPSENPKSCDKIGKSDKIRILFGAARLDDPIKDLPTLIRATQILKERFPEVAGNLELVTFGGIKNPEALDDIHLPATHSGKVAPAEIRSIYEACDIVVSTSVWETLPGTLIEGQAWGCIPVALDHGGQSDIIDHLQTGYLAPWSDDRETRALSIAEGIVWGARQAKDPGSSIKEKMHKKVCDQFSEESVANHYISLFESLISKA